MNTIKKVIYITSVLFLVFYLSSCCKCKPDTQKMDTIYLENFSQNEISNPKVIISYSTSNDTISLVLDTLYTMNNRHRLIAPKTLNIHRDWFVNINDSLHYTVKNFQTETVTRNCCKGLTYLSSYQVNGTTTNSSVISIEK